MTIACDAPNPDLGVALRFADYTDCQARALGENGFQALTGGPLGASMLSGLVTIFIAVIGYQLLLGRTPGLRDGVTWTVRLGVVLTLTTSWPAFQVLAFRVAVDGPAELASYLLPATGLRSERLDDRIQEAYDTIRIGFNGQLDQTAPPSIGSGQSTEGSQRVSRAPFAGAGLSPLPQTASVFLISTAGVIGAFKLAIGFLLAIGPIAVMALLFDNTIGLFNGWIRALGGASFASLGAIIVTAVDLAFVEAEIASRQTALASELARAIDPQALATIVLAFSVVMLITTLAAIRVVSVFKLLSSTTYDTAASVPATSSVSSDRPRAFPQMAGSETAAVRYPVQSRVGLIVDGLATAARREELRASSGSSPEAPTGHPVTSSATASSQGSGMSLGISGRRSTARRTRRAARRDGLA